ncbi:MAG: alpha/beta hydrolase [Planctomycetota bacterium]
MKKFLKAMLAIFFVYALASAAAGFWATSQFKPSLPFNMAALGFNVEDVEIKTSDGVTLRGWYSEGPQGAPAIVLLHGFHATRTDCLTLARALTLPGYTLLLLDMRASGKSDGHVQTLGVKEKFDVEAALHYMKNVKQHSPRHTGIVAYGTSASAAIFAYNSVNQLGAAVLLAPYSGLDAAINARLGSYVGPNGPWMGAIVKEVVSLRVGKRVISIKPEQDIAKLAPCPVLLVGAGNDTKTPPADVQNLYDKAADPKEIYIVPGVSRDRLTDLNGSDLRKRIIDFFDDHLK